MYDHTQSNVFVHRHTHKISTIGDYSVWVLTITLAGTTTRVTRYYVTGPNNARVTGLLERYGDAHNTMSFESFTHGCTL